MKDFRCSSCQKLRKSEQLGKIVKPNNSKRCVFCCANADAARKLIKQGVAA